jgi:hypothetical protein
MAIRADGGKNRDWVSLSCEYLADGNSPEVNSNMCRALGQSISEVCLAKTEWIQLPQECVFSIPLSLPDLSFITKDVLLSMKMYIRSGALLNIVKREYCLGECTVRYSQIVDMVQRRNRVNLPLTKGMLAEMSNEVPAALTMMAVPRMKFVRPCNRGWSLTEPSSTKNAMFQLPLDQSYAFPIDDSSALSTAHRLTALNPSSSTVLIANERTVESTLVLPLATAVSRLAAESARQSVQIARLAAERAMRRESLQCYAISDENDIADAALNDGCAYVELGVVALLLQNGGLPASASMAFQRCDSIFEETLVGGFSLPIMDTAAGEALMKDPTPMREAAVKRFCPRVYTGDLVEDGGDALLPGVVGTSLHGYVGSVRVVGSLNNSSSESSLGGVMSTIEGVVPLEPYLNPDTQRPDKVPVLAPAVDANTGKVVGKFLFLLRVRTQTFVKRLETTPDPKNGLISTIGLNTLTEGMGMSYQLDNVVSENAMGVRQRQVATMGAFLTSNYLKYHAEQRANDAAVLQHRFEKYYNSVMSGVSSDVVLEDDSDVPLFKRRTPRPFRPSNSRQDALLAGIGFNVHVQSMTLHLLQDGWEGVPAAVTASVTHGAPADHARGFGVFGNDDGESTIVARGGLRRLESARLEYAREVDVSIYMTFDVLDVAVLILISRLWFFTSGKYHWIDNCSW